VKAALEEAAIVRQRHADLAGTDDGHAPVALEAEDLPEVPNKLRHGVAEPTLAEGPEEGEVLADLRRGGAAQGGELLARGGGPTTAVQLLEIAQVGRQPSHGRIGDAAVGGAKIGHGVRARGRGLCEIVHKGR
jgi:hypothetical protein